MENQAKRILVNLPIDVLIKLHDNLINQSNSFHYENDGKDDISGSIQHTLIEYNKDIKLLDRVIHDVFIANSVVIEEDELPF